jgi:two-component system, LytTR family, sensor kinase
MNTSVHLPKLSWPRILVMSTVILLAWTFFGLLNSFQMYVNTDDARKYYPLSMVLHLALGNNLLKGVISLPFIWIFYRAPIALTDWRRRALLYFLLLPVFCLIHAAVRPFVIPFMMTEPPPPGTVIDYSFKFTMGLRSFFVDNAWGFFCAVLVFHAWQYAFQARQRALNESMLEARLASAELQVLKMQLHPHFLFNTLNTIYNLIPVNGRHAQIMTARLGHLLRVSLDHVTTEKVPLHHELDFLMEYVEIEKARFEERLRVEQDVPPDTLQAEVPNMILQPLVENAVRHGISKKASGGMVKISAKRDNGRLVLTVTNDGRPASDKSSTGIGLANTRARLTKLYGDDFSFNLEPFGTGTRVSLSIPFEEGPDATPEELQQTPEKIQARRVSSQS